MLIKSAIASFQIMTFAHAFKNKIPVYSRKIETVHVYSFQYNNSDWYFYLQKVQALERSQQTVVHIPSLVAVDIMYKTGSGWSEFCRQQLPEETEKSPSSCFSCIIHHAGQECLRVAASCSWKDHGGRWVMEFRAEGAYFTLGIAGGSLLETILDQRHYYMVYISKVSIKVSLH